MPPPRFRLVVATRNNGKFLEIKRAFRELPLELVSLASLKGILPVVEDQETFEGNARKKALEVCRQTGFPTLADDSGIVVDALGGRPGVCSARYAGPKASDRENWQKLLIELGRLPSANRSARYVCVLVLCLSPDREFLVRETCEGTIASAPRGAGGFGYDPVFFLPERGKTMAEIDPSEKNKISHRGKALQKMAQLLENIPLI